jgi:hypothetical protein
MALVILEADGGQASLSTLIAGSEFQGDDERYREYAFDNQSKIQNLKSKIVEELCIPS